MLREGRRSAEAGRLRPEVLWIRPNPQLQDRKRAGAGRLRVKILLHALCRNLDTLNAFQDRRRSTMPLVALPSPQGSAPNLEPPVLSRGPGAFRIGAAVLAGRYLPAIRPSRSAAPSPSARRHARGFAATAREVPSGRAVELRRQIADSGSRKLAPGRDDATQDKRCTPTGIRMPSSDEK
jgi:hypothetical protein